MDDDAERITLVEGIQIVEAPDGTLVARSPRHTFDLGDVPRSLLEELLEALGDGCTVSGLDQRLAGRVDPSTVRAVIDGLTGFVFEIDALELRPDAGRVVVVGNAALATRVVEHLTRLGVPVDLVAVASVAVPDSSGAPVITAGPPVHSVDGGLEDVTSERLARELAGCSLAVVALERVPFGAVVVAAEAADVAGVPLLPLAAHPGAVVVGPLWGEGHGVACATCVAGSLLFGPVTDRWPLADVFETAALSDSPGAGVLTSAAAAEVVDASRSLSAGDLGRLPLASAVRLGADGSRSDVPFRPRPGCPRCGPTVPPRDVSEDGDEPAARLGSVVSAVRAAADDRLVPERAARRSPPTYRSVGVIGGGTAGYLTALALRRRFPSLDVTLLESSAVGVVGVGEATTPRLVQFLHGPDGLGLDIVELHERVRPVWKLGVYYDWSPPDAPPFPWPFEYGNLADAVHHDGHLIDHCLGAALMDSARTPLVDYGDGQVLSLLRQVPFAYHLDNETFVSYLQDVATRIGVNRYDVTIDRVVSSDDGSIVDALVTDDGQRFEFDLYVDCTGFRSLLLEGALGSRWLGYDDSLFCDAAVVANAPHDGFVRPYTEAQTMDAGWCWRIAFDDEDHRGYVFSSRFLDDDRAVAEMRARNPGMGDHWMARFRSGRHAEWWRGNVVALGNAYGFVEPLASTALHLLIGGIDLLCGALPTAPGPASRAALSKEMGDAWDDVRCWLATQYRFNRRLDTEFWRECRSSVALHEANERIERYRERAPLSASPAAGGGYFADDYSYDVVLAGQQVPARWVPPPSTVEDWRAHTARLRATAARALPQRPARELVHARPELLAALAADPEGWVQRRSY